MHNNFIKIADSNQKHLDSLVCLFGIIELCKVTGAKNIFDLVNRYQIPLIKIAYHIGCISTNSALKNHLSPDLNLWVDDIKLLHGHMINEMNKEEGTASSFMEWKYVHRSEEE